MEEWRSQSVPPNVTMMVVTHRPRCGFTTMLRLLVAAFLLIGATAFHGRPHCPSVLHRGGSYLLAAPADEFGDLISLAVSQTEDASRAALLAGTVRNWAADARAANANGMSDALSARAIAVQQDAIAAHGRGEDVTRASSELQALVDMTVQLKLLVRELNDADAAGA